MDEDEGAFIALTWCLMGLWLIVLCAEIGGLFVDCVCMCVSVCMCLYEGYSALGFFQCYSALVLK